jgi:hypothetical protein
MLAEMPAYHVLCRLIKGNAIEYTTQCCAHKVNRVYPGDTAK